MAKTWQSDHHDLESFGYQQVLSRTLGKFSSFAISFSLISIITGIFANFQFGFQQVGSALLWSWALVGAGQFLVALVMADLSVRFPLAGYGYQWSSRLVNPHMGFFVGWLLLLQFITGFPGVCQALATTMMAFTGMEISSWTITLITVAVISLIALIHIYGIRLVTLVNDAGVYAEIFGVIFIIGLLWGIWIFSGNWNLDIFLTGGNGSNNNWTFSAFALSLLVGAWCLTGFEAAADLAEETHQPRAVVPNAIITSQVSAAIAGFLMIAGFIALSGDTTSSNIISGVLESHLGRAGILLVGVVVALSIFACGVACMATATRLLFSMARDNMTPLSTWLKKVDPHHRSPRYATLMVWVLGTLLVVTVRHLEIITSISAAAGYMGYVGILSAALFSKKLKGNRSSYFSLGRWRTLVQWTALIWTAAVVLALTVPEHEVPGLQETRLTAKSSSIAVVIGILAYITIIRKRIVQGIAGPPRTINSYYE